MSGTSSRWGSFSVSVARTGEGVFLESSSGRSSGSGLAGREQGWGVLEIEGDFCLLSGFFKGLVFPAHSCLVKAQGLSDYVPRRSSWVSQSTT